LKKKKNHFSFLRKRLSSQNLTWGSDWPDSPCTAARKIHSKSGGGRAAGGRPRLAVRWQPLGALSPVLGQLPAVTFLKSLNIEYVW